MTKKGRNKKPREEVIEFYANIENIPVALEYDFLDDSIKMKNVIIDSAKLETSYKKDSGKNKRINSTPIKSSNLSFKCDKAIFENYDVILAIDTNTKIIKNKLISVTSSYFINRPMAECNIKRRYPFDIFAAHLFVNIKSNLVPEKLGWYTIITNYVQKSFPLNYKIGIVVDCDLGVHDLINYSKAPYFEDVRLPENIQLIYASSDTRNDSIANQLISYSDKHANDIINSDDLSSIIESNFLMKSSDYCEAHCSLHSLRN